MKKMMSLKTMKIASDSVSFLSLREKFPLTR